MQRLCNNICTVLYSCESKIDHASATLLPVFAALNENSEQRQEARSRLTEKMPNIAG